MKAKTVDGWQFISWSPLFLDCTMPLPTGKILYHFNLTCIILKQKGISCVMH